jgi:hypothetical protein
MATADRRYRKLAEFARSLRMARYAQRGRLICIQMRASALP